MRHRFAIFVLTVAACGLAALFGPPSSGPADMSKYLPDGAGFYVHINVQQFLASR